MLCTDTEDSPEKYARFIPLYDRHLCWSLHSHSLVLGADQTLPEKLHRRGCASNAAVIDHEGLLSTVYCMLLLL